MKVYRKILVLPDLHSPWVSWDAVQQAYRWKKRHKPDLVICLGDLTDQKIWSRWPKDLDDDGPSEEFKAAEKALKKLHKMFPKLVILRGNHDLRILTRAIEAGIPGQMFKDVDQVFAYKGWKWLHPNEKFIVQTPRGPVLFVHGDEDGGTVAIKSRTLGMNVCQGHTHHATITYTSTIRGTFWGAEAGTLMDTQSKAAKYAEKKSVGTTVGFFIIKYGVPYLVDYHKGMKV